VLRFHVYLQDDLKGFANTLTMGYERGKCLSQFLKGWSGYFLGWGCCSILRLADGLCLDRLSLRCRSGFPVEMLVGCLGSGLETEVLESSTCTWC
jgi:hypothetical protein